MNARLAAVLVAGLALSAPALAKTDKETPGAPCSPGGGQGTGNPCNGNNGNPSPQGNAKVRNDQNPPTFSIVRPGNDRGAYIDQIGDPNSATISQTQHPVCPDRAEWR